MKASFQRVLLKGYLVYNVVKNSLAPGLAARSSATGGTCVVLQGEKRHVLYRAVPYCTVPFPTILYRTVPFLTVPTVPYCATETPTVSRNYTVWYRIVILWRPSRHPRNSPLLYIGTRVPSPLSNRMGADNIFHGTFLIFLKWYPFNPTQG